MPMGCTQSTHPSLESINETGSGWCPPSKAVGSAELKCQGCDRVVNVAQVGCLCSLVPFGSQFPLLVLTGFSAVGAQGSQSIKAIVGPPTDGRLLLTANSEKSRYLCCTRFVSLCSSSSAPTSLRLQQKPGRTGSSTGAGSQMLTATGMCSHKSSLPDAFWSCGSQRSSLQVFPSTEAASSEVISICKAPAETVQVGGKEKLAPVPFAPQWEASFSVVQIAHAWSWKLRLLPKKPSNY